MIDAELERAFARVDEAVRKLVRKPYDAARKKLPRWVTVDNHLELELDEVTFIPNATGQSSDVGGNRVLLSLVLIVGSLFGLIGYPIEWFDNRYHYFTSPESHWDTYVGIAASVLALPLGIWLNIRGRRASDRADELKVWVPRYGLYLVRGTPSMIAWRAFSAGREQVRWTLLEKQMYFGSRVFNETGGLISWLETSEGYFMSFEPELGPRVRRWIEESGTKLGSNRYVPVANAVSVCAWSVDPSHLLKAYRGKRS